MHHPVSVSCTPWELARVHVNCACGCSFCLSARGRTRMTSCVGRRPRPRASWEWHPAPTTRTSAAQAAWVHPPSPSRDRSSSSPWSVQFWWTILVLIQTLSPEACEEQTPLETVRSDLFFPQSRALWLPTETPPLMIHFTFNLQKLKNTWDRHTWKSLTDLKTLIWNKASFYGNYRIYFINNNHSQREREREKTPDDQLHNFQRNPRVCIECSLGPSRGVL